MIKQTGELKVALVGPYPPPYGGVSIHVQRLFGQKTDNSINFTVFDNSRQVKKARGVINLSKLWNWPRVLFSRQDIIHVHTTSTHWIVPAIFYCLAKLKGARFIISFHSLRYVARDFGIIGSRMIRKVLSSASHCIATNDEIKKTLLSMGAGPERISVIPAFLPPENMDEEIEEIPEKVWNFINAHTPIISAGAFRIVVYEGIDRYGIDMCIELCIRLKNDYPNIGFIYFLPEVGESEYFNELKRRIAEGGIAENFLFQTTPCQFYPVIMKSSLFVRPTNTDGDAISLREALYLKTPSVASDAVTRPAGTVIFKNRDVEDFTSRVKMVLKNWKDYKAKADSINMETGLGDILNIYRNVSGKAV